MKINAAVGFLLGALSLITLHRKTLPKSVGWMFAFAMTLIGVLTLCEYLVGLDLGIDQLIVNDFTSRPGIPPGRMAMVTAVNFSLVGIALILLHCRSSQRVVQALHSGVEDTTFRCSGCEQIAVPRSNSQPMTTAGKVNLLG